MILADLIEPSYARELIDRQRDRIARNDRVMVPFNLVVNPVCESIRARAESAVLNFLDRSDEELAQLAKIVGFPEFEEVEPSAGRGRHTR